MISTTPPVGGVCSQKNALWWGRVPHFAINVDTSDSKDESSQQSPDSDTDEVSMYRPTVLYRQAIINLMYYYAAHDDAYVDDVEEENKDFRQQHYYNFIDILLSIDIKS